MASALTGLMQRHALTTSTLIDHASRAHGGTEIVSRESDGRFRRSTWREVAARARKVAALLAALGAVPGDRIATLAWNRLAHLELYFGVTGAGLVLHTVNPRLFAEQIAFIIEHGGARIVCVDSDLWPVLEPLLPTLPAVEKIIVLGDAAQVPAGDPRIAGYEDLLAGVEPVVGWPDLDEEAASSLCYTSGTTGPPKGVLYSHRSTVLHAFAACAADSMALSARDSVLLVTPLFHVNAWGVPFAAAMCGAKLVLPGTRLDGEALFEVLRDERCTFSLGVPTIWFDFLDHVERNVGPAARARLSLNRVFTGGAATPQAMVERFRDLLGVEVMQAWGMTETSPVATVCRPLAKHAGLDDAALATLRATQGRAVFGVELKIEPPVTGDTTGGTAAGLLKVRGPWVFSSYFGDAAGSALDAEGWSDTGDIATIDDDGYLRITDRAKDVVKSGGEWISSIDLENAASAHPAVAEAAVIGVPHSRWQERPLLLVRLHPGAALTAAAMLDHLAPRVARWWLPDDVVVVDELPHTATGKVLKATLRHRFRDHLDGR